MRAWSSWLPRPRIEEATRFHLQALAARQDGAAWIASSRNLFHLLLEPFSPFLAGAQSLVVVSDGILGLLPFETLIGGPDRETPERRVSYLPDASLLPSLGGAAPAGGSEVLVVADPETPERAALVAELRGLEPGSPGDVSERGTYERGGFDFRPLLHAREEAERIVRRLAPGSVTLLAGRNANEAALKALDLTRFGCIHFATHAFFDAADPMRSAIVLAPGGRVEEDGFLQMREISG